ncbi:Valyl-tRNA synthetase [hydrothermal vent metagenome]|uniref:valine--tRNA ligase n=1 Tax=hydrothermal vent metagenome TaxID=652676 RepID=A0A3B0UMP4_9ZZZZ
MDEKFLKPYSPSDTEKRIYELWEKSGFFNPDNLPDAKEREPFSMVLPPPNVTGTLHMGSALMLAIEDTIVRFKRMRGYRALWLPGTDSAAIATQARVEKNIQKTEKKNRHDLGRDELLKRIDDFVEQNKTTMLNQMRAMGASLDWSRYAYTMDDARYRSVMEAFMRMYEAGLIYRDYRIVNWDPKGQTTISDDEIVHEERKAKLYTFRYSKNFPIPVATTRPETKVGDVAVAVHPDDARYQKYVGKEYDAIFCDVPIHIKIVSDKAVDPKFGTGAVGVTPAHSQTDWEIADRHNLPHDTIVINGYAKMTVSGRLEGKKVIEAREIVVDWLNNENLMEKEEDVSQNISTAERTGGIIEPLPKLQWWVDVDRQFVLAHSEIPGIASGESTTLKEIMRKSVESGATTFVTERYKRVYFNWIDNLRPWCISRQIWFGHRIPVWYKDDEMKVQVESPGTDWEQDPDVLDTWFSSGLWTFSTLGWPDNTDDLATYHPTELIETAYDIIFFWIARMILMSGFFIGQVPFKHIYIHGLVRDVKGRKISKSLGNNIDPVDMADKYGMDAVRLSLVMGTAPGTDSRISEDKIRGYKHFANKLWNITRFILERTKEITLAEKLNDADANIHREVSKLIQEVTDDIDKYRIHLASEKLYQFVWHRFADEILEESKPILMGDDQDARASRARLLRETLDIFIRLLHPFMPFVTEEIWQRIPDRSEKLLMIASWPSYHKE